MKKIKINFCKYNPEDTCSYSFYIINILKKYYDVEISQEPNYLFFNESDPEHILFKDCIKIFYTGENIHPNFNICDYAIGFDYMDFGDRYYRLPIYMVSNFYRKEELEQIKTTGIPTKTNFSVQDLKEKRSFCSFVYSNYLADQNRKIFFDKLSTYKKVNSGGKYLNNTGKVCQNKLAFENEHKFSIAFENSSRDGYTTEKLLNSIMANTIPIYWGNPKINLEFNTDRFINCHDFENFDEVIKKIIEIDKDDSEYIKIINTPSLLNEDQFKKESINFEKFLVNIFNQDILMAKRLKINKAIELNIFKENMLLFKYNQIKSKIIKILSLIYKPFKSIDFIKKMKETYFINKTHLK